MAEAPIINTVTTAGIEAATASDPDTGAVLGLTVQFTLTGGGTSDVFFVPLQGISAVLIAVLGAARSVRELQKERN